MQQEGAAGCVLCMLCMHVHHVSLKRFIVFMEFLVPAGSPTVRESRPQTGDIEIGSKRAQLWGQKGVVVWCVCRVDPRAPYAVASLWRRYWLFVAEVDRRRARHSPNFNGQSSP